MSCGKVKVTLADREVFGSLVNEKKYEDDSLTDVIGWLTELLGRVPDDLRKSARVGIESVGGHEGEHHAEVRVYYYRPETDEEMKAREDAHKASVHARENREREEFERLRKKFG